MDLGVCKGGLMVCDMDSSAQIVLFIASGLGGGFSDGRRYSVDSPALWSFSCHDTLVLNYDSENDSIAQDILMVPLATFATSPSWIVARNILHLLSRPLLNNIHQISVSPLRHKPQRYFRDLASSTAKTKPNRGFHHIFTQARQES